MWTGRRDAQIRRRRTACGCSRGMDGSDRVAHVGCWLPVVVVVVAAAAAAAADRGTKEGVWMVTGSAVGPRSTKWHCCFPSVTYLGTAGGGECLGRRSPPMVGRQDKTNPRPATGEYSHGKTESYRGLTQHCCLIVSRQPHGMVVLELATACGHLGQNGLPDGHPGSPGLSWGEKGDGRRPRGWENYREDERRGLWKRVGEPKRSRKQRAGWHLEAPHLCTYTSCGHRDAKSCGNARFLVGAELRYVPTYVCHVGYTWMSAAVFFFFFFFFLFLFCMRAPVR
ncbi:hypothetical protein VTJ83DRAFT_4849 [Remersonia thermophila]|uniref:Uncharacterized protein n=1 Tax=Remersonia thermophila TaxID=72144 RepID=A0ABR4DDB3_9PEZI